MALALLLIVPLAALAQTALPEYAWIGAGVRTRPAYDGSAAQRTDLIPTVRYYGGPWFARTTQGILEGGARTELARGRHFVDGDRGAQGDLRFTAVVYGGGAVTAGVFIQGTWADSKSNQSFYGIAPAQSTNLPAYSAGSGPLFATGGLLWGVDLGREWIVVGNLEARRLHGDAARSPLAERRSNHYASASLAYRF